MKTCVHCGESIEEPVWNTYINEAGTDLERVHRACGPAYEAARDRRAAESVPKSRAGDLPRRPPQNRAAKQPTRQADTITESAAASTAAP